MKEQLREHLGELAICSNCGRTYHIRPSYPRFCSEACAKEFIMPDYRKQRIPCLRCGKEFTPYRPQQKYCSKDCGTADYNESHNIAGRLRAMRVNRKEEEKKKDKREQQS